MQELPLLELIVIFAAGRVFVLCCCFLLLLASCLVCVRAGLLLLVGVWPCHVVPCVMLMLLRRRTVCRAAAAVDAASAAVSGCWDHDWRRRLGVVVSLL